MRVTFDRKALLAAAEVLLSCVPKREVKPILQAFLLTVAGGSAELAATDLETGCRCELACGSPDDGSLLVLAEPLVKLLRELPDAEVVLEEEEGGIRLEAARSSIRLPHLGDTKNYPDVPRLGDEPCHEADAAQLRRALDAVRWALPTPKEGQAAQKWYGGVNSLQWLVSDDHRLHLTATDGHVLGTAELPLAGQPELPWQANDWPLLPAKAAQLLSGVLSRATAEGAICKVRLQKNDALFQAAGCTLYSRLSVGTYPDWRQHWPKQQVVPAVLDRDALLSALRQAAVLWDDLDHYTVLNFTAGELAIENRPSQRGGARVSLLCRYAGADLAVCFQGPILLELVRALPAGDATLGLIDAKRPVVMSSEESVRYLAVPCAPPEPEPVKTKPGSKRKVAEPAAV